MSEDVLTKLMLFVYFPIVGTGFVSGFILQRWLWKYHREVWVDLGSPSIGNQSIATSLKGFRFLFGSRYRALNDPVVTWSVWIGRAMLVSTVGMATLFLAVMMVAALQKTSSAPAAGIATRGAGEGPLFTHDSEGWRFHRPPDLILFLGAFTIVYFIVFRFFLVRLRRAHTETWVELGRPLLFLNNTPMNNLRVLGFIMSDRPRALGDRTLTYYVYVIRALIVFLVLVLVWTKRAVFFR